MDNGIRTMNSCRAGTVGAIAAAVLFLVAFGGCAGADRRKDVGERLTSEALAKGKTPDAEYVVEPPDVIRVEFFNEPGLTRSVRLRQDGNITLPYVEDVHVAGLTADQIREKLEGLFGKYHKNPRILVTVESFASKHIYIYGEVGRRGQVPYTGSMTLADAIGLAGGVSRQAATSRVQVIRGDKNRPRVFTANLDRLIEQGMTQENISLAEDDVVYVPPTAWAQVGNAISDALYPIRAVLGLGGAAVSARAFPVTFAEAGGRTTSE